MRIKKSDTVISVYNFTDLAHSTGNIYESISVICNRAKNIVSREQKVLEEKLEEFRVDDDDLGEVFENEDQIALSKYYEKMPKPGLLAIREFLKGDLCFHYRENSRPSSDTPHIKLEHSPSPENDVVTKEKEP